TTSELKNEPFDVDEYIERLAWRTPGGGTKGGVDGFDPRGLLEEFVGHIQELKILDERIQRRVEKLEASCQKEAKEYARKVQELQKGNQVAFQHFQELDEHISYVATKVCHLGDQLEGVNTPRQRAVEAQKLMRYFNEFLEGNLTSEVFTDPSKIQEAADIIQKLHLIAQELPFDRFSAVKSRIASKYHDMECQLIQEFTTAQRNSDIGRMREVASVLLHFKGYSHCVDVYIKQCQESAYLRADVFEDAAQLCQRVNKQVGEVFSSPESVMARLVQNIYELKLQTYVRERLEECRKADAEQYLTKLYDLYSRKFITGAKSGFEDGNDVGTIQHLQGSHGQCQVKGSHVEHGAGQIRPLVGCWSQCTYAAHRALKWSRCPPRIQDLKERIRQRTNLPLGTVIETHGETFLSQEVVVTLLQETKTAFERCHKLSDQSDLPKNAVKIFYILVDFLCVEHIDYALELGLSAIPSPDAKNANLYFLDVVQQANTVFHLFDKQFSDHLMPLVSASPKLTECLQKKKEVIEQMELKLDNGIDRNRTLNCMLGQTKQILNTEQKKTDFKPEDESVFQNQYTNACVKVCAYVRSQVERIRQSMDGKNVETVLTEFGLRLHRLIYEHQQQFTYNSTGGMLAICDLTEYQKCAKEFQIPLVLQLFNSLHALCNLLVVAPDNLKQMCSGEQLSALDRSVLHAFVQLRVDYKSARLGRHFS
uniref:Exocyst complex component 5 n=1 Tax=Petromyzon marinus TaxID=7757 RepID=S4RL40_PETMA